MTESKIEQIIREVSFAAQCAEMALQGVKAAAYDSDLLSFPEVQELSEVNYRLDYLSEDLKKPCGKAESGTHDRRWKWKLIFLTGRISALCSRV